MQDMGVASSPILERRGVLASRDPEETRAFMQTKEFTLELSPRDAGLFDFFATAAYLPSSYIGYIRYGSRVDVRVPPHRSRDDFFIHLPIRGQSEVVNTVGTFPCGPGHAVVSSPAGHLTRSEELSERITISLNKSAVLGQLAALLGEPPARALEFAPAINLASTEGRRFTRHAQLLIADLDDPASAMNPILLRMYEQLIMTGLLLCQGNTYTDALSRLEKGAAPRAVRRAIDYIEGHLDAAITLADVAAAAGIPGRTLLKNFKDHRGISPIRYLRDARLGRIRQELARGPDAGSVTEIAMTWGVTHLGRFAAEYRARFGESPSDTQRRSRLRARPSGTIR